MTVRKTVDGPWVTSTAEELEGATAGYFQVKHDLLQTKNKNTELRKRKEIEWHIVTLKQKKRKD